MVSRRCSRALAGLDRLVDLLVGGDDHLLQVAQQGLQFRVQRRLRLVGEEPGRAIEHRVQLGQGSDGFMRLLRQQHLVVGAEQPVNEALKFLRTHASQVVKGLARGGHLEAWQPKRVSRALVLGQPVPQPVHEHLHHILDLGGRGELG